MIFFPESGRCTGTVPPTKSFQRKENHSMYIKVQAKVYTEYFDEVAVRDEMGNCLRFLY